ncbi:MAG: hypothetical protein H0V35_08335 [Nitrospira sp.]|nr:hypothetical protein [Nitrospira sp.]
MECTDASAVASILVIDDEEAVGGLFRAILEPVGYTIVEVANGRGAPLWRVADRPGDYGHGCRMGIA